MSQQDIFIDAINRKEWGEVSLAFGVPFLVTLGIAVTILSKSNFTPQLIISWLSTQTWSCIRNPDKFERISGWLALAGYLVLASPLTFVITWGAMTAEKVNTDYFFGLSIIYFFFAALTILLGCLHWRYHAWRLTAVARACFAIGITLLVAFELWAIFRVSFQYHSISIVFASLNMIPMSFFVFLTARARTKQMQEYPGLEVAVASPKEILAATSAAAPSTSGVGNGNDDAAAVVPGEQVAVQEKKVEAGAAVAIEVRPAGSPRPPLRGYNTPATRYAALGASLAVLLAYGLVVSLWEREGRSNHGVGWITVGAICALDLTTLLLWYGKRIVSPGATCLTQMLCRALLVGFGDRFYFVGHAFMYFVLATFFAWCILDRVIPSVTQAQRKEKLLADLGISTDKLEVAEQRYASKQGDSEQLQKLAKNVDLFALALLTIFFIADIIIISIVSSSDNDITVLDDDKAHRQYIVGIMSLFLVAFCVCSAMLYRLWSNNDFAINRIIMILAGAIWAVTCGFAGFWYGLTESVIVLAICVFFPPIAYASAFAYSTFMHKPHDYRILPPRPEGEKRPWTDYMVIIAELAAVALICGLGATISVHSGDAVEVGFSISAVLLVLAGTAIPVIEYRNGFKVSRNIIAHAVITLLIFTGYLIMFWQLAFDGSRDTRSAVLLFVFFAYPVAVILGFAIERWKDNQWKLTPYVRNALAICFALGVAFCILVIIFLDPWQVGATMLVAFVCAGLGLILFPIVRK